MSTTTKQKLGISHVVKLDDENYEQWRLQITLILKAGKFWDVVSATDTAVWDQTDIEAQALIVPTLTAAQTNHIYACKTSHEIFEKLKSIHSDASSLNKQHTLTSFFNFKVKPDQSLTAAFTEIERLARSLNEMGVTIDETRTVTKIVSALPEELNAFKKAWDSVPSASQTMSMLFPASRKKSWRRKSSEPAATGRRNPRKPRTTHS
jgi:hypothetical protein